jgi:hypothetical protein
LGGLSSLLKPDALSAKGEIFLHQSLQNKVCEKRQSNKRIEYKKYYSHYQKKLLVDELQEKYSLSPPSSDAWKHEQEYFLQEGLWMT